MVVRQQSTKLSGWLFQELRVLFTFRFTGPDTCPFFPWLSRGADPSACWGVGPPRESRKKRTRNEVWRAHRFLKPQKWRNSEFCNSSSELRGRPRRESYGNEGQKTVFVGPKVLSLKTKESQTGFDSVVWARKASMMIEMMAKLGISRLDTRCWPLKVCWRKAKEQCHFWFEK